MRTKSWASRANRGQPKNSVFTERNYGFAHDPTIAHRNPVCCAFVSRAEELTGKRSASRASRATATRPRPERVRSCRGPRDVSGGDVPPDIPIGGRWRATWRAIAAPAATATPTHRARAAPRTMLCHDDDGRRFLQICDVATVSIASTAQEPLACRVAGERRATLRGMAGRQTGRTGAARGLGSPLAASVSCPRRKQTPCLIDRSLPTTRCQCSSHQTAKTQF